jgi:hypothetical protein
MIADRLQLAYTKTYDYKEKLNPSLAWFKRISNEALLGFLSAQESGEYNDLFSLLSERFVEKVKARKDKERRIHNPRKCIFAVAKKQSLN